MPTPACATCTKERGEAEFPRDIWELRRLGLHGNAARLRFDRIPQPWLRELGKRWVRWRLSTGLSVAQAVIDVLALTRLAAFLASSPVPVDRLADLSRAAMERYLAQLAASGRPAKARGKDLGSLSAFLTAIRQHHWDTSLPASAVIYREDYPKPDRDPLARALAEQVMAQVEQPTTSVRRRRSRAAQTLQGQEPVGDRHQRSPVINTGRCRPAVQVTLHHSITSRMLGVDLDGSRGIWPAHVGCLVGPGGSRRIQKDRLDDHRDDRGAFDTRSDGKASSSM
jgi:hypothetical protein